MKRKWKQIVILVAIIGLVLLTACSQKSGVKGEILVGLQLPLSGNEANMGQDMQNASELAVEQINAAGGINGSKLKLIAEDDACDPQTATAAANKLVSEKVIAIVGGYCSGATIPATSVYHQNGIPIIVSAANSQKIADQKYPEVFMIDGTSIHQSALASEHIVMKNKAQKVAIIHDNSGYAKDLAELTKASVEKDGGQVILYDAVNPDESDFSPLVSKLKQLKPDATFWTGYYKAGGLLIKQFKQQGVSGFIGVGDGSNDKLLVTIAGQEAVEGTFITTAPTAEFLPDAKTFIDAYKAKFKQDPGTYSALQYDGIYLLADAIKRAGSTDREAIVKELKKSNIKLLSGVIEFNDVNTLKKSNFVVLKIKDAKFVLSD